MPQQIPRSLVYFPNGPSGIEPDLAALAASPFYSNVVLGQFHFNEPDGHITWNETTLSNVSSSVWTAVGNLAKGQYPKIVSMQMGTAGNGTWKWIADNMDAAAESLIEIVNGKHPIIGIDLDPEPPGDVALDTIYKFTLKLGSYKTTNVQFYLSHVPVPWDSAYFPALYGSPYWAKMAPFIDWITPQWYGTTGPQLAAAYKAFVTGLTTPKQPLPPPIVVAGQQFDQNSDPSELQELLTTIGSLRSSYSRNWGGVGIWAYPLPTSPDWAQAIRKALQ